MSEKKPVVSWSKRAYNSLNQAHQYIGQTSPTNAEMVKEGILAIIRELPQNPEKFPPDRFKNENNGTYRAFEAYSYRVPTDIPRK